MSERGRAHATSVITPRVSSSAAGFPSTQHAAATDVPSRAGGLAKYSSLMRCTLLVAFLACASPAHAQDLTLKAAVIVPGTTLDSAVVTVRGGRIASVAAGASAPDAIAID